MFTTKIQAEPQGKAGPTPKTDKLPEPPEKKAGVIQAALVQRAAAGALPPPNGKPTAARAGDMLAEPPTGPGAPGRARMSRSIQRSVGNTRINRMLGTGLQAQLKVNAPGDVYEQEADRVAEKVTQNREESSHAPPIARIAAGGTISVNRQARQEKETGGANEGVDADMQARIQSSSGGRPLPGGLRQEMEPGLGSDLSNVRVHDNAVDKADADRLNAKAFTYGSDIWIGSAGSANDRKLMAHELTHTIQQGAIGTPGLPAAPALMRFVGTEHATLGNTTRATIDLGDGIVLTWGQVVAIAGDEYGTVEELETAISTPEGKARLRAALEHDGVPGSATSKLPEPTAGQRSAQDKEFIRLAMENTAHFPDGGQALGKWAEHHARAIEAALSAGLANDPKGINKAYLYEAFGEHFLTDAFSGGHIRTPRAQIVEWYTGTFAPRVVGSLIANLRSRVVQALVDQANPQAPNTPEFLLRSKINERVQTSINNLVASMGGMAALTRWVGLGVAGAVSGAMHDVEGETGVLVASDEHPAPWRAFGDKKLEDSPISKEQATKAVAAAKADVDTAYVIGEEEGVTRAAAADAPPSRVYFAFNASDLIGPAARASQDAAAYLLYHPQAKVELVGHTDPIGPDNANETLGLRRAQAVEQALLTAGVAPSQISVRSEGERALVTTVPKMFRINRRTEFTWRTEPNGRGGTDPQDLARGRARAKVQARVGPPYNKVTRFVPRPVEERGGTGNAPLPDWHWGRLSSTTRGQVDNWIRTAVGTKLDDAIATASELNDVTESDITLRPRDAVRAIATQLLANPTSTLGDLVGEAPGP